MVVLENLLSKGLFFLLCESVSAPLQISLRFSLCLCIYLFLDYHKKPVSFQNLARACNSKPGTRTMSLLSVFFFFNALLLFFLNRLKFNKAKLIPKAKDFFFQFLCLFIININIQPNFRLILIIIKGRMTRFLDLKEGL